MCTCVYVCVLTLCVLGIYMYIVHVILCYFSDCFCAHVHAYLTKKSINADYKYSNPAYSCVYVFAFQENTRVQEVS